jgi:hypothetical protein
MTVVSDLPLELDSLERGRLMNSIRSRVRQASLLLALAVTLTVDAYAGERKKPPDGGPGPSDCTEPCWHASTYPGGTVTDVAIQRRPCCEGSDWVVALGSQSGIYKSEDAGKTFALVQPLSGPTYNIAAGDLREDNQGNPTIPGLIYAATDEGLWQNTSDDLKRWTTVSGLPTGLKVTFVGYVWTGSEYRLYATVDATQPDGGLHRMNSDGSWTRVAANLNVVAMASSCSPEPSPPVAVTRPCAGCAAGAVWKSSSIGDEGSWSVLPDGQFGPKTTALNDIATGFVFNGYLLTNADNAVPLGCAVLRAPSASSLNSWDDILCHDTTGSGGINTNRATNVRCDICGLGGPNVGCFGPSLPAFVGTIGNPALGTGGLFAGNVSTINWSRLHWDSNVRFIVTKWIRPFSIAENHRLWVVASGGIWWHKE